MVRTHVMRIIAETHPQSTGGHEIALAGLKDADALVRRCARPCVPVLRSQIACSYAPTTISAMPSLAWFQSKLKEDFKIAQVKNLATPGTVTAGF